MHCFLFASSNPVTGERFERTQIRNGALSASCCLLLNMLPVASAVSVPDSGIRTTGGSILWRVRQTHQAENLGLIRSQLCSRRKSISSEKWGETRVSLLPSLEWLKNLAIYKKYASCTETDKACLWITLPYNSHLTLFSFLCHCYEDCKVDNGAICKLNKMFFYKLS